MKEEIYRCPKCGSEQKEFTGEDVVVGHDFQMGNMVIAESRCISCGYKGRSDEWVTDDTKEVCPCCKSDKCKQIPNKKNASVSHWYCDNCGWEWI